MKFLPLKKNNRACALEPGASSLHASRGFTLIEMLVAVFIFTLSLTSLMLVSSRGLKVAKEAQNQITADYLALEAVEVVRNVRDSALLRLDDSTDWSGVFDQEGCLTYGAECAFILNGGSIEIVPCDSDECDVYLNKDEGVYRNFNGDGPDSGFDQTRFVREINFLIPASNTREIVVEVLVTWNGGSVAYSENLFLWL
jgi:prepilin-type N-terminal cleavage/methylation domain-containing protein